MTTEYYTIQIVLLGKGELTIYNSSVIPNIGDYIEHESEMYVVVNRVFETKHNQIASIWVELKIK